MDMDYAISAFSNWTPVKKPKEEEHFMPTPKVSVLDFMLLSISHFLIQILQFKFMIVNVIALLFP